MRKFSVVAVLLTALLVAIGALSGAAAGRTDAGAAKPSPEPVTIQLLNVSDWHGNLDPVGNLGGAWNLSARWKQDRTAYPTLTLTAGDDFGATPALSNFFNEEPAIKAQRMMGIQVGALGNHNFDRGVAHLQQMVDLAATPAGGAVPGTPLRYVAANLKNLEENVAGVSPVAYFNVGGAKVAVIGITNEEAPGLVLPGSFGTVEVTDSVAAANKFARIARQAKADAVVVITHKGITATPPTGATGPLLDFVRGLEPGLVDVVLGDHTDIQYSGVVNGVLVHENRSYGGTYAKTLLKIHPGAPGEAGRVLEKTVSFVSPSAAALGTTPGQCPPAPAFCDQAILDMLVPYRQQLAAMLDEKVTTTAAPFDNGGTPTIQRSGETPLGDLIADGMRWRYGTQLALMNGGGIRQQLPTCTYAPTDRTLRRSVWNGTHTAITTCAGYAAGGPYDIVLGDIFSVLPFGNIITTRSVTGAQIWAALENGVSRIDSTTGNGADGRFPQISGFKFTFDYGNTPGSRVTDVRLSDGTAIPNNASTSYTIALPNFMNLGGDGYTMFADGQGATQELDAVVLKEYMQSLGTAIDPAGYPLDRITKVP